MKRIEEIEKEATIYTDKISNYAEWSDDGGWLETKLETNDIKLIEKAFKEGAKWADETMIKKACEKLNSMLYMRDCGDYDCVASAYDSVEEFVEEFRKYLEE